MVGLKLKYSVDSSTVRDILYDLKETSCLNRVKGHGVDHQILSSRPFKLRLCSFISFCDQFSVKTLYGYVS